MSSGGQIFVSLDKGPRPLRLPAALHQRPHRPDHRSAKTGSKAASDGVTAGFRFTEEQMVKILREADGSMSF